MSVPPLEAPMLNMIAELMPGMAMAKISSRTGWSVSGPDHGKQLFLPQTVPQTSER